MKIWAIMIQSRHDLSLFPSVYRTLERAKSEVEEEAAELGLNGSWVSEDEFSDEDAGIQMNVYECDLA